MRASLAMLRYFYSTFFTLGIFHEPFNMVGSFSLRQYKRIISTKSSLGAGSQLDSLSGSFHSGM